MSNAGGLGIITALIWSDPEGLRQEIRKCRIMTARPFAVNITLLPSLVPPDYPAYAQVIIDEGIKIVETAGNSPGPVIALLKKAGITVLHKCTTIRHAKAAIKLGVDFLSIDGFECAGYVLRGCVCPDKRTSPMTPPSWASLLVVAQRRFVAVMAYVRLLGWWPPCLLVSSRAALGANCLGAGRGVRLKDSWPRLPLPASLSSASPSSRRLLGCFLIWPPRDCRIPWPSSY